MHLILFHYNSGEWLGLPFIFPVQKNLQLPVQVPMGFLTRPVTADHTRYHTGHHEYGRDHEDRLHHASVPCVWPRIRLIAIAEMNMPEMMYTRSMLEYVDAKVYAHCYDNDPKC